MSPKVFETGRETGIMYEGFENAIAAQTLKDNL